MATPAKPRTLPRYLALAGPTAAGKTAAALAIAQRWPVEIISVDSALVYHGMDIGTAKPSAAELAMVPHHLINILEPSQTYSAAQFVADAQALMWDISARGKLPLLVGGTMLYFKALRDGLDDMPRTDPAIRGAIALQATQQGWPALHAELARVDPVTAARLAPADAQRISRALEIYRATGKPMASFHTIQKRVSTALLTGVTGLNVVQNLTPDSLLISLEPQDRAWLHQRIAERFELMLAQGFLAEVQALRTRADLHADLPSMRCVGYRQAWELLAQTQTGNTVALLRELRDKGIIATRQLAKRQLTWLRSMPERQVVACDAPDALAQVLARVELFVFDPAR